MRETLDPALSHDSLNPGVDSELFRVLVEGAKEYAIYMLDRQGFIQTWNQGAQRIKGYRAEEIIGRHFSCFYEAEDIQSGLPQRELATALKNGKYEDEGWRLRRDGSRFFASVVLSPLMGPDGSVYGFSKITRDITARRTHELEMSEAKADLERRSADLLRANAELEAFAYSVSHDLRAPLRHLDGFADLLLKRNGAQMDESGQRYVGKIIDSSKKMGCLIDDLLDFSRLANTEILWNRVDLNQLQNEVRIDFANDLADRNVIWQVHQLPVVTGDRAMLRLALVNLLSNALKYTSGRPETHIEMGSFNSSQKEITFFIRDNGVGFEMEYVRKLFHIFQRLHAEEFAGTGVGLAIVRRIIERHHGRVWAEGVPDQGATFYFTLPAEIGGSE